MNILVCLPAGSMRLLGPNTIGLVNLTDRIPLSASGALVMDHFPAGSIGVASQSGGILGARGRFAHRRHGWRGPDV